MSVPWARRLEEARQARARALAARREGAPGVDRRPLATATAAREERAKTAQGHADPSGVVQELASPAAHWRILPGFLVGLGVGAIVVGVLLWRGPTGPDQAALEPVRTAPPLTDAVAEDAGAAQARLRADAAPPAEEPAIARGAGARRPEAAAATAPDVADAVAAVPRIVADAPVDTMPAGVPARPEMEEREGPRAVGETAGPHAPTAPAPEEPAEVRAPLRLSAVPGGSAGAGAEEEEEPPAAKPAETQAAPATIEAGGAASAVGAVPAEGPAARAEGAAAVAGPSGAGAGEQRSQESVAASETVAGAPPVDASEAEVAARGLLHVHAAPRVAPAELQAVLARLRSEGFRVEEAVRVDFRISRTNVRFFHAEDADLADEVAGALSAVSRDFTDYRPTPPAGTIEIWLEG